MSVQLDQVLVGMAALEQRLNGIQQAVDTRPPTQPPMSAASNMQHPLLPPSTTPVLPQPPQPVQTPASGGGVDGSRAVSDDHSAPPSSEPRLPPPPCPSPAESSVVGRQSDGGSADAVRRSTRLSTHPLVDFLSAQREGGPRLEGSIQIRLWDADEWPVDHVLRVFLDVNVGRLEAVQGQVEAQRKQAVALRERVQKMSKAELWVECSKVERKTAALESLMKLMGGL